MELYNKKRIFKQISKLNNTHIRKQINLEKNISKSKFSVLDGFRVFNIVLSLSLDLPDKKTGRNLSHTSRTIIKIVHSN